MGNKNKYRKVEGFLVKHAAGISSRELAELVNREYGTRFTTADMQQFKKARKIKSGVRGGYSDLFPKEIAEYIKANYEGIGHKQQAENLRQKFGKEYTPGQIKSFYANHNLNSGLTGRFEPGQESWNKGKQMGSHPNSVATQFKKGSKPHNTLKVGDEVIRMDGYHKTKIAEPNTWRLTHLLVWEQAYGEIPEGMYVEFKDGNRDNIAPDNLFLLSKPEHLEMNRSALRSVIPEYTEAGAAIAKLRCAARERKKVKKNGKPGVQRVKPGNAGTGPW